MQNECSYHLHYSWSIVQFFIPLHRIQNSQWTAIWTANETRGVMVTQINFEMNLFYNVHFKGHSRVSIQNLPQHVLTWNFSHRFASMWSKTSRNDTPRNSFFSELWRGKETFKKWFFLKTAWPILMKKIYVVETNEAIPQTNKKRIFEKNCS